MKDSSSSTLLTHAFNLALLFIAAVGIGALALFLVRYTFLQRSYQDLFGKYSAVIELSTVQTIPRYGIVQAINPQSGSIEIQIQNRYVVGGAPYRLTIYITSRTSVLRQELVSEGGAYVVRTSTEAASISDLRVGDKVAALLSYDRDRAEAAILYFGDPL